MRTFQRLLVALLPAALVALTATMQVAGLSCGPTEGFADEMVRDGWPQAAPYEHVVIATVLEVRPERDDSATWGEVLHVRLDAVLRGNLPLTTTEIFNPPLGGSGWIGFRAGGQYLIGAHDPDEASGGRVPTFLCAANEEITSEARFTEFVSYAAAPRLPDTAASRNSGAEPVGWLLLAAAMLLGGRQVRAQVTASRQAAGGSIGG